MKERSVMDAVTELDRLIERRSRNGEVAPDELEPGYLESVRRYNEERRRENIAAWHSFHLDQAERIERAAAALVASHRARAEALEEAGSPW